MFFKTQSETFKSLVHNPIGKTVSKKELIMVLSRLTVKSVDLGFHPTVNLVRDVSTNYCALSELVDLDFPPQLNRYRTCALTTAHSELFDLDFSPQLNVHTNCCAGFGLVDHGFPPTVNLHRNLQLPTSTLCTTL